jgi:hypothetical protein
VLYPDLALADALHHHWNHQHLGETFTGRRPERERVELLHRLDGLLATTSADVAMISYEGFLQIRRPRRVAQCLRDLFARRGYALEILVTIKPQDGWLNSFYTWRCQFLRETRPFAGYLSRQMSDWRLNYAKVLVPWRAMTSRITAVPVCERGSEVPLILRILQELGLQERLAGVLTADVLAKWENRSPGPVAVAVCRRMARARLGQENQVVARDVSTFVERAAESRKLNDTPFQGFDERRRADVKARFAVANDIFARSVWGTDWSERVAPESHGEPNELLADTPEVEEIFTQTRQSLGLSRKRESRWRNWLRFGHPT